MRTIIVLPLVCLAAFALPQSETFGKTEAQILAMGEQKWDDFYQSKAGNSTAAMVEMNVLFGTAAEHRNERLAKQASPATRARVQKLRKLLNEYAASAIDIGYNVTGGGTLWAQVSADITPHAELVLFGVLGGKSPKSEHLVISGVKKQLSALALTIETTHADKDAVSYFKYDEARASLAKMRVGLIQILAVAKGLDRANSDRVLLFCRDYAETANGDWN